MTVLYTTPAGPAGPGAPAGTLVLQQAMPVSYSYYRMIKKQPTVALARRLALAPLLRASWSVEGPDAGDVTVALAQRTIKALRGPYMNHVTRALYDYGFAAMEVYLDEAGASAPAAPALRLKPLLNDLVSVVINPDGTFAGLSVREAGAAGALSPGTFLPPERCVFLGFDAEAGSFYGLGALEISRETYKDWQESNLGARRYDRKIAGTFLQLTYVAGERPGPDGTMVDNAVLAQEFLEAAEAGGCVAVPIDRAAFLDAKQAQLPPDFKLEFLSDASPRQGSFVERMRYLDAMLVRAWGLPERAVLEGMFGTKAEAEAHGNLGLTAMEAVHEFVTGEFWAQVLLPYLALVTSPDEAEAITLTPGPINPEAMLWKRSLVEKIITVKPEALDLDALMDETGAPKAQTIVTPAGAGGPGGAPST